MLVKATKIQSRISSMTFAQKTISGTLGCIIFGLDQKVLSCLARSKFRPNLASQETLTDFHGNEAKKDVLKKSK